MNEVTRMTVWSNGKSIRAYRAQDKRMDVTTRTPEKGYRKMTAVLYDPSYLPQPPQSARELYGETPLEAYRKGFSAGYYRGRVDEMKDAPYDDRIISERNGQPSDQEQRSPHA